MGSIKRKTTVEECRRIAPEECAHVGAATVETRIGNTNARRLWALCPDCETAVRFLFLPPDSQQWKCRKCHKLTTHQRQRRGTRAEFEAWLTPARYSEMSHKHPALTALYEAMATDWRENVLPYQWEKVSHKRRAELLTFYANEKAVSHAFNERRAQWSARTDAAAQATGEQIRADLWRWWKSRNRSKTARTRRDG